MTELYSKMRHSQRPSVRCEHGVRSPHECDDCQAIIDEAFNVARATLNKTEFSHWEIDLIVAGVRRGITIARAALTQGEATAAPLPSSPESAGSNIPKASTPGLNATDLRLEGATGSDATHIPKPDPFAFSNVPRPKG